MFESLGRAIVRNRKSAVALFIISVLVSGVIGSLVFSRLDSGGYSNPASESYEVYEYLKNYLKIGDPAIVVVVDAEVVDVTDPTVVQKAATLEAKIAQEPGVEKTLSYWSSGGLDSLKSSDGKAAYILIYGDGDAFSPESQKLGKFFQENYDG